MADDLTKKGPQDRARISLSERHEIRYWVEALGVTEDELRAVVEKVGNSASAVREALKK